MTTNINYIIIRECVPIESGPCTCKDHTSETWISLKDFKNRYTAEDLDVDFDLIGSEIIDAASGHIFSEEEVREILHKDY